MRQFKVKIKYIEPKRSQFGIPLFGGEQVVVTLANESFINSYCDKTYGVGTYIIEEIRRSA